jgi:hypothetical protein
MLLVIVDTEIIDFFRDYCEISILDEAEVTYAIVVLDHILRILPSEERMQEQPVLNTVQAICGRDISRIFAGRDFGNKIKRRPDVTSQSGGPQGAGSQPVRKQLVMNNRQCRHFVSYPWSVNTIPMAEKRGTPRFVECDPIRHAVAEQFVHDDRVIGKMERGIPNRPAAPAL